jgi:hypothetical protein
MNKILIIAAIVAVLATAAIAQQCDASAASTCANTWASCVLSGGTNVNTVCACYGPYFTCLRNANCLTDAQLASVQDSCNKAGCTAGQCSSAVSISGVFGLFVAAVAAFF